MLEANMPAHITFQLLNELLVLAWWAADELRGGAAFRRIRARRLLSLKHRLDGILH